MQLAGGEGEPHGMELETRETRVMDERKNPLHRATQSGAPDRRIVTQRRGEAQSDAQRATTTVTSKMRNFENPTLHWGRETPRARPAGIADTRSVCGRYCKKSQATSTPLGWHRPRAACCSRVMGAACPGGCHCGSTFSRSLSRVIFGYNPCAAFLNPNCHHLPAPRLHAPTKPPLPKM